MIDTTFSNSIRKVTGLHSDHQPFLLEGIPVLGLVSNLSDLFTLAIILIVMILH